MFAFININNLSLLKNGGDPVSSAVTSEGAEAHLVIWGTDVNVQDTKKKFKEFLETFVLESVEGPTQADKMESPLYMTRLDEVCKGRCGLTTKHYSLWTWSCYQRWANLSLRYLLKRHINQEELITGCLCN